MKLILLLQFICGFMTVVAAQQNFLFIYIGSDHSGRGSVLITSDDSQVRYLEGKDSRMVKVFHTDQRTLDSIRSYIWRNHWVNRCDTFNRGNGEMDSLKLSDAYKIVGVDSRPLYVGGEDCLTLFLSTWYYLDTIGFATSGGPGAMENLALQCEQKYIRRHLINAPGPQIEDPYPKLNPETRPPIRPHSNFTF